MSEHSAEKGLSEHEAPLPCCLGRGPCQAPPDIGPCAPLPTAESGAPCPKHRARGVNPDCPDCDQPYSADKDAGPEEQDHDCLQTCACGGAHLHGRTTVLTDGGLEEHSRTICGRLSGVDRMLRARVTPPEVGQP